MSTRNVITIASLLLSWQVYALSVADLTFESGAEASNYSAKGKPSNLYSVADTLPQDVLTNVYSMLPEGSVVNSAFIAPDKYSSIDIDDELNGAEYATARITFLNEGAGYRNTLGYFVFDTNNPPTDKDDIDAHIVVFPNASKPGEGEMQEGDTIDLGVQLTANQTLAFFLIPNGWGWEGSYNNIANFGNWGTPFYSYPALNPETTMEHRRHNVAFLDVQNEFLVLSFEDIKRPSGDNDFNDLIFTVAVTPFEAIDGVNSDGTTDSKYETLVQENDPDISVTSVYPSSDSMATIAFEDRWPLMGDYDFNDVVWSYKITEQINGQRELTNITIDYTLQAMGAGYSNGFALQLPNVDPNNLASVALTKNGQSVTHTVQQASNDETIFIIAEDLRAELSALGGLPLGCHFYKTDDTCLAMQQGISLSYQLTVELTNPVSRDLIGYPPYDPFIFASEGEYHGDFVQTPPGMSWQTHMKAFGGTSFMDNALFGLHDDRSGGAQSFLSENNMPWVINIRDQWDHPKELVDITVAYPNFPNWVTSAGEQDSDWYNYASANQVISSSEQ
ncbi:LruC domain-containing protein [Vibrio mediterranei]|uniref:LruC domain-containing protein n=1 Tax=Vibrio mediterranei TaxID=689 RepID=UPI0022842799|nr:LruC domain-containing protein [Vibrio mediterranei]MCY9854243.1 LruC domain-containing protein [Vibrio mediterranei]